MRTCFPGDSSPAHPILGQMYCLCQLCRYPIDTTVMGLFWLVMGVWAVWELAMMRRRRSGPAADGIREIRRHLYMLYLFCAVANVASAVVMMASTSTSYIEFIIVEAMDLLSFFYVALVAIRLTCFWLCIFHERHAWRIKRASVAAALVSLGLIVGAFWVFCMSAQNHPDDFSLFTDIAGSALVCVCAMYLILVCSLLLSLALGRVERIDSLPMTSDYFVRRLVANAFCAVGYGLSGVLILAPLTSTITSTVVHGMTWCLPSLLLMWTFRQSGGYRTQRLLFLSPSTNTDYNTESFHVRDVPII